MGQPEIAQPPIQHKTVSALLKVFSAALFVVIWYCLAHTLTHHFFAVSPWSETWRHDLVAHLAIAGLLLSMAQGYGRFLLTLTVLFSAFTVANALKIAILGGPIMPDDFIAARNLLLLLEGWQLWGSVALVLAPLALLAWMFAWRRPGAWLTAMAILIGGMLIAHQPDPVSRALDARFGDWVWNQRGNFEQRGLPIHLLQETARNLARRGNPPNEAEIRQALATLDRQPPSPFMRVSALPHTQRNLHMIVLESFWDPKPLKSARFSRDPIDPAFRKLWAATGHSKALSPVFGGYTANAEFEALCGFPVTQDAVFFEGRLRQNVPCLPAHLADAGYLTHASHPNAASFWNRVNAYRRIGFETYWSTNDFRLDDMNRDFLSDQSLYRQVMEKLSDRLDGPAPVFNYVLTYFGHLDYPLNSERPTVISAPGGREHAEAYANTVYYKSRELMAFLKTLRKRDPHALIVIFGDHPPYLGMNHANYTDSGLLAATRGEFTDAMFRTLVATPLIVIDGKRGPLKLGELPMYELPSLILSLLGDERESMLHFTRRGADQSRIRPLPGLQFVSTGKQHLSCRGGNQDTAPACLEAEAWLNAVKQLKLDIFSGAQHALAPMRTTESELHTASLGTQPLNPELPAAEMTDAQAPLLSGSVQTVQ